MFLVAFPLVGLLAAYGLSASHQDRYESSAKLLLHDQAAAGVPADAAEGGSAAAASTRETATNVNLVSSDEVALRVYMAVRPPMTLEAFLDSVRIASEGDSELVTISARETDPALAARIANAWADQYRAFRREADDARAAAATAIVDQRLAALPPDRLAGTEGQGLRRQRDELAVAASLQRANVEVAQRAREATSPVSPRPVRAALIGGLVGLAIALVLALLAQRLDRRVADADAAAALHGLPLLGQIPKAAALAAPGRTPDGALSLPPLARSETDAFRVLRTSISYPDVERRIGSVLITSAVSGEGKTTVALNLARAYAESGARTLLIEGDLRRPVLSGRLSLEATPGLADVLRSETTLESATRRVVLDPADGAGRRPAPRHRGRRGRGLQPADPPRGQADVPDPGGASRTGTTWWWWTARRAWG